MKLISLLALIVLSGCANYRIAGEFRTPYGSVSSDGKTIKLTADYGYRK